MLQSLPATSSFRLFLAALALCLWAGVVLGHGLPTIGPLSQARVLTFEDVPYKLADNTKGRTTLEIVEYENGGHYVKFLDTAAEVPLGSLEWLSKITGPGWTNDLRAALRLEIERGPPAFQRLFTENVSLEIKLKSVDSWKVLDDAGVKGLSGKMDDIIFVDDYLKKNPGKASEVTADIKSKGWQKWVDEVNQVGLANYSNVRKYLANSRTKQYLTNQELLDFEKTLKQAHPDVLKHMDGMDEFDFAEMVRGYRDLKNNGKLSTFDNAIKSGENFYGNYGWLSYWKLTPGIKYSLTTIDDLKKAGKLLPTGNATDIQLASLQAFTRSGDFINVPMRYNPSFMGDYAQKGLKHIEECLVELRKVPSRQVMDEVYSGKTYSKVDFESMFVGGTGKPHPNNSSYVSSSKVQSVAEGFIDLTKKWAGDGEKVAVIQRIISKHGVYIDDLSDWGEHLGRIRHYDKPIAIQRQYEVLLDPNTLKQIGEPIPIMENGVHKTIEGMKAYYVDFTQ